MPDQLRLVDLDVDAADQGVREIREAVAALIRLGYVPEDRGDTAGLCWPGPGKPPQDAVQWGQVLLRDRVVARAAVREAARQAEAGVVVSAAPVPEASMPQTSMPQVCVLSAPAVSVPVAAVPEVPVSLAPVLSLAAAQHVSVPAVEAVRPAPGIAPVPPPDVPRWSDACRRPGGMVEYVDAWRGWWQRALAALPAEARAACAVPHMTIGPIDEPGIPDALVLTVIDLSAASADAAAQAVLEHRAELAAAVRGAVLRVVVRRRRTWRESVGEAMWQRWSFDVPAKVHDVGSA